jgi:hypothetical protein
VSARGYASSPEGRERLVYRRGACGVDLVDAGEGELGIRLYVIEIEVYDLLDGVLIKPVGYAPPYLARSADARGTHDRPFNSSGAKARSDTETKAKNGLDGLPVTSRLSY